MKGVLPVIFFLAGCGLPADYRHVKTEDGSGIYSITSLYDGSQAGRARITEWMDLEAQDLCESPYALISQESVPIMNRLGEAIYSRLIWKIRCREEPIE